MNKMNSNIENTKITKILPCWYVMIMACMYAFKLFKLIMSHIQNKYTLQRGGFNMWLFLCVGMESYICGKSELILAPAPDIKEQTPLRVILRGQP